MTKRRGQGAKRRGADPMPVEECQEAADAFSKALGLPYPSWDFPRRFRGGTLRQDELRVAAVTSRTNSLTWGQLG